jgi:hypothetical protein
MNSGSLRHPQTIFCSWAQGPQKIFAIATNAVSNVAVVVLPPWHAVTIVLDAHVAEVT